MGDFNRMLNLKIYFYCNNIGPIFVTVPAPNVKTKSSGFEFSFIYSTIFSKLLIYTAFFPIFSNSVFKSSEVIPNVLISLAA